MKEKDIEQFEKVDAQLQSVFEEIGELAKKKPDDGINKFKLKIINGLISEANVVLGDKNLPISSFSQFDDDDVPTNSDVILVCGQYLSRLEKLRSDNIVQGMMGKWYWKIEGRESPIRTAPPKKINSKE